MHHGRLFRKYIFRTLISNYISLMTIDLRLSSGTQHEEISLEKIIYVKTLNCRSNDESQPTVVCFQILFQTLFVKIAEKTMA